MDRVGWNASSPSCHSHGWSYEVRSGAGTRIVDAILVGTDGTETGRVLKLKRDIVCCVCCMEETCSNNTYVGGGRLRCSPRPRSTYMMDFPSFRASPCLVRHMGRDRLQAWRLGRLRGARKLQSALRRSRRDGACRFGLTSARRSSGDLAWTNADLPVKSATCRTYSVCVRVLNPSWYRYGPSGLVCITNI